MFKNPTPSRLPSDTITMSLACPDKTEKIRQLWPQITTSAAEVAAREPALARLMEDAVLSRRSLEEAVAFRLARKFGRINNTEEDLRRTFLEIFESDEHIGKEIRHDILAIKDRDPACPD